MSVVNQADLSLAPMVWVQNAAGVRYRVRAPKWVQAQEMRAKAQKEAEEASQRAAEEDASAVEPRLMSNEDFERYAQAYRIAIRAKLLPGCPPNRTPANTIIAEVADRHGLQVSDLRSRSRKNRIAHARQEAMYLIRQRCKLSLPQIGRLFGGKDHTTVLYGVRAHAARIGRPV